MPLKGYEVKTFLSINWVRIFYHSTINQIYFNSSLEASFCYSQDKFSVLKFISEKHKISSYYEFLLEYPSRNQYLHFKQTLNPTSSGTTTGHSIITNPSSFTSFSGFSLSTATGYTFLDGQPNSVDWWYSIGCRSAFGTEKGMPGPIISNTCYVVSEVILWIRVNSFSDIILFPELFPCSYHQKQSFILHSYFYFSHIFIFLSI
jgi:hypothetical protein